MAQPVRLISNRAPIDSLISYFTDASPIFSKHAAWFADHHRDGTGFIDPILQATDAVLKSSANAVKEDREAVMATEIQQASLTAATDLARYVREQGSYISSELLHSHDDADRLMASRVRTACGVGSRLNAKRQSGLRRLLAVQKTGLEEIKSTWLAWKRPADTAQKVASALTELTNAIELQSKEKVEADMAQDDLEARTQTAVDGVNRMLRLVNVSPDAPKELLTGLSTLEREHHAVLWQASEPGNPEEPAEPEAPSEPIAPNDPVVPS